MMDSCVKEEWGNQRVSKTVTEILLQHYPAYVWAATAAGGQVVIQNLTLSGQWGFVKNIKDLTPKLHEIVMAGGEILERYKVSREVKMPDEALKFLARDFRGNVKCETL